MTFHTVSRVVRRGGALRSTTAELIRVKRHKCPDAHRRPAGDPLHAGRQPVIPTCPVQLGHRHQMPGQVLRKPRPVQLPFPILGGDVSVRDLTVQRVREFPGHPVHVLRPRTGELVYPAQMRPRVGEDGRDDPSDISRGNRRGLAPPERQFDVASVADGRADEAEEEALQEDRRPDGDDRQAGPPKRLLAEPVLPLLRARVVCWMLIWETVIWDMLTRASTPTSRATAAMITVASRYPADTDMPK